MDLFNSLQLVILIINHSQLISGKKNFVGMPSLENIYVVKTKLSPEIDSEAEDVFQ